MIVSVPQVKVTWRCIEYRGLANKLLIMNARFDIMKQKRNTHLSKLSILGIKVLIF